MWGSRVRLPKDGGQGNGPSAGKTILTLIVILYLFFYLASYFHW